MKTEGILQGQPMVAPVERVSMKSEPEKHETIKSHATDKKDKEVTKETAENVARALTKQMTSSHKIRFVVRDVTKTSSDNVIIQIMDKDGKVISEIPSEKVKQMAEEMRTAIFGKKSVGILEDDVA